MKKLLFAMLALLLLASIFYSCSDSPLAPLLTVTDIDGNVYSTIRLGTQTWMVENLKTSRFRNGDAVTGSWFYRNDTNNGKIYGRLYDLYAVNDPRGLAPEGWHIPSDAEWTQLINYLGGEEIAGGKLKDTILWLNPNTGATNQSGFSAFPAGCLVGSSFSSIRSHGYFWSSSEYTYGAWIRSLRHDSFGVFRNTTLKSNGLSVRCIMD